MLSPNWITPRALKIWVVVTFFCLTVYYVFSPPVESIIPSISSIQQSSVELLHLAPSKERFIKQIIDNEVDGPTDHKPLAELCASKTATPGLIIKCEPAQGGIGNVRNSILNCLRYAIEAGATTFVLPTIQPIKGKETKSLEHFFDASHFSKHLSNSCPQMKIVSSSNDLWMFPSTSPPIIVSPEKMTPPKITKHPMQINPPLWVPNFFTYLKIRHPSNFSAESPILVSLKPPLLLQWPLAHETPAFVATFGRLLRLRRDVRELAAVILWHMNEKYQLGIESRAGITQGQFYGAHLRTAKDALGAGWTSFKTQSKNYINHAKRYQLQVIYAASGNPEDLLAFAKKAKSRGIAVTTKEQLLKGVEDERLRSLEWDLRTCVDWEVMLRASQFGGIRESSWSWGIAARRHIIDGDGTWVDNLDGKLDDEESKDNEIARKRFGKAKRLASPENQVSNLQNPNLVARRVQHANSKAASGSKSQGSDNKAAAPPKGALRNGNKMDPVENEGEEDEGADEDVDEDGDENGDDGADGTSRPEADRGDALSKPALLLSSAKPVPASRSAVSRPLPSRPPPPASRPIPSSAAKAKAVQADPIRVPAKQKVHQDSIQIAEQQSSLPSMKPPYYKHQKPSDDEEILEGIAKTPPALVKANGTQEDAAAAAAAEIYQELQQKLAEEDAQVVEEEGKGKEQTFQDRFSILFGPTEERDIWFGATWP